ncbi:DNA ligase [Clostridioides mangenotii]|uniref:ATP-dependent DNA ligase n=1 Tax=Metaclostridioides mangenotii TaxID=1540 RepID=UPI001C11270D|nr:RNA ligase family protein [Clostridioides mangenotii]MBU5306266.1 DNA ligase [Clostridioides mangenotii]
MDIFDEKGIKPMLINEANEAFDSPDYIYELKLDGIRCIAYLDKDSTDIRNKRDFKLLSKVPELSDIHKNIKSKCILDGELIVTKNGVPDFFEIQRRSLMSDPFKIQLAGKKYPASFIAYDILYLDGKLITDLTLLERKKMLADIVVESDRIAVSRYIENKGITLYELAKQQNLEGIVAKEKNSKYYMDSRTKNWIKIKFLKDDDFIICGYLLKEKGFVSLIIGKYKKDALVYKGHVTLGVSLKKLNQYKYDVIDKPDLGGVPDGHENAIWITPNLVCTVEYMPNEKDLLRQPVLKSIREDKSPYECIEK